MKTLITISLLSLMLTIYYNLPFNNELKKSEIKPASNGINIILIYADDLGYGHLGVYGQDKILTPNINRMAENGMLFTNFYSGSPYCFGARISLMTGNNLGQNKELRRGFLSDSLKEPKYMPRYFQKAGYRTAMYGKWGFGTCDGKSSVAEKDPYNVGFDEFLGYLNHRGAHSYTIPPYQSTKWPIDKKLWEIKNNQTIEFPTESIAYTHQLFVDKALEFIEENKSNNFFLYLPFTIPHAELLVPDDLEGEDLLGQYLNEDNSSIFPEIPWSGKHPYERPVEKPRAVFAAMISRLDRDVGKLLYTLKSLKIDHKTLVIFTSDNGPHDAGGIISKDFFNATAGLNGMKWSLYEGGIKVPFIAYWPGTIKPGSIETEPRAQEDLLVTFTDIINAKLSSPKTGVSLLPIFTGEKTTIKHDYLYWQANSNRFVGEALRKEQWKIIRIGNKTKDDKVMLFDLENDPWEKVDVSKKYPFELIELKKLMNSARIKNGKENGLYKYKTLSH